MQTSITIGEADYLVDYDYRVTAKAVPAKLHAAPEDCYPAEPMEFEITINGLRRDPPHGRDRLLPVPEWLASDLEEQLLDSDSVYADICEAVGVRDDR